MKQAALILLLFFSLIALSRNRYENFTYTVENLKKKEIPDSSKLFVFVGEKIYFKPRKSIHKYSFYKSYIAKYKVIKCIYGNCKKETVKFRVYSHLELKCFPQYALLFVNKERNRYELEYRQVIPVAKTKDGRWASCGHRYGGDDQNGKKIEPVPLKFEEDIWHNLSNTKNELIPKYYPEPYFEIVNDSARCLMGYYVEDLFIIQKYSVLKARNIFK